MGKHPRLAGAALGLAALAVLTACDEIGTARLDFSTTEQVALTGIVLDDGGSGNVAVRGEGATGEVRIDRVVRYRGGDEPGPTYRLDGTVLHIDTDCGRWCSVDYDIVAPPGVAVSGENGSGDITLADVATVDILVGSGNIDVVNGSGDVTVEAGSGEIAVTTVGGRLDAQTGSGNVEARGVAGSSTRVHTGSGDVSVVLARAGSVDAEAGSGNIELTVPDGSYRVETSTGSGETDIRVAHDPAGEHLLKLDSGSGDITVAGG